MFEIIVTDKSYIGDKNFGSNKIMGYNYAPIHLVSEGYRFIPLYNIRNDLLTEKTGATLFVEISISEKERVCPATQLQTVQEVKPTLNTVQKSIPADSIKTIDNTGRITYTNKSHGI
jgi:hypothetical protein